MGTGIIIFMRERHIQFRILFKNTGILISDNVFPALVVPRKIVIEEKRRLFLINFLLGQRVFLFVLYDLQISLFCIISRFIEYGLHRTASFCRRQTWLANFRDLILAQSRAFLFEGLFGRDIAELVFFKF